MATKRNWMNALVRGGPVGLAHTLREAWLARRMRRISLYMYRERELHRKHMAEMKTEMDALIARQQSATARAAAYWSALS